VVWRRWAIARIKDERAGGAERACDGDVERHGTATPRVRRRETGDSGGSGGGAAGEERKVIRVVNLRVRN
jgi:hypothetical protein